MNCGPPEDIAFGSVPGNTFSFGDTLTYVCDLGYVLRGEANRTCQADGSWSNAAPYCECESWGRACNTPGMYVGRGLTIPWAQGRACNALGTGGGDSQHTRHGGRGLTTHQAWGEGARNTPGMGGGGSQHTGYILNSLLALLCILSNRL